MQRVTSTVERTSSGTIIVGFEYIYDDLSRIVEEKVLADSIKKCYTYDSLGRVTARVIKHLSDDSIVSTELFAYDAAGNITLQMHLTVASNTTPITDSLCLMEMR